ncbi:extracellular solute-binding protein [Lachnospiraceae bacterium 54-53]
MKKKLCLLLSTAMLAGSLAGCSSGASGTPAETQSTSEAAKTETSVSESSKGETEKPYAGTTIRVLSMTGQISDAIEAYLNDFEDQTGIKVNLELYGESQLREKCTTEFLAGSSTIDAFLMSPLQDMAAYSNNGWIEPLDDYLTDASFDWEDFSSAPMDQIKIKSTGAIGALPLYSSVQLMFYRKDVFKDKGLTPPTTYDELLEVCEKLNDPSNNFYPIACRGEKIALTSQFSPFLYGFGGSYFKDGTSAFNTPENLEAAKFYGKLLGTYAPEGILTAGYSQMTQLFNAGQVAMCIDAIALYQTLIDANESAYYDKVGVAPVPEGPAGRQSYKQVVWGASIYSGSRNKEAAWEFLKFVSGEDIAVYITPMGMPSFRASIWADDRVTSSMPQDFIEAYNEEIMAETTNQYGLPRMTAVSEARDAMGEAIVYSIETKGEGAELESRMKAAAEKVDQLLKDAGEYGADYPYEK